MCTRQIGFKEEALSKSQPKYHYEAGSTLLESTSDYTLNYQLGIPANYVPSILL